MRPIDQLCLNFAPSLRNADLQFANFLDANLKNAYLENTQLRNTIGLTFDQLKQAKNLYGCTGIPPAIKEKLQAECPHLFKKPDL